MAWPDAAVLDEIDLKVRRVVIDELQQGGLWPEIDVVREVSRHQQALGQAFVDDQLRAVLGSEDLAWLQSESLFGTSNHRLRGRIPMLVGFGGELAGRLHRWLECRDETLGIAQQLGALFNLGMVVFDLVCDELPFGYERLSRAFNVAKLRDLFLDARGEAFILAHPEVLDCPELRILFKIIAAFFRILRARVAPGRSRDLQGLIEQSFLAQLSSIDKHHCSLADIEGKSALPFIIIGRTVRACCASGRAGTEVIENYNMLLRALGDVFWRVDDFADLSADLSSGAVNGIVLSVQPGSLATTAGALGRHLLDGPSLPAMARALRNDLETITRLAAARTSPAGACGRFDEFVLVAVRRWIERHRPTHDRLPKLR